MGHAEDEGEETVTLIVEASSERSNERNVGVVVSTPSVNTANDFFIEQDLLQKLIDEGATNTNTNSMSVDGNDPSVSFLSDPERSLIPSVDAMESGLGPNDASVDDEFVSADVDTLDLTVDGQQPTVDVLDQSQLEKLLGTHVQIGSQTLNMADNKEEDKDDDKSHLKAPKRRSQRQMEKEMKEEAERIRMENQQKMKEEANEAAAKPPTTVGDDCTRTATISRPIKTTSVMLSTIAPSRPRRERKVPAHLRGDFETPLIKQVEKQKHKSEEKKAECADVIEHPQHEEKKVKEEITSKESTKAEDKCNENTIEQVKIDDIPKEKLDNDSEKEDAENKIAKEADEGNDEDDDDESMSDWNSEDDPDRLWCVCQQPHNNRFMICCDSCLDWYHGKCVGVTKAMGKAMEEAGNEWRCPKCKTNIETAEEEKRRNNLMQTLKDREKEKEASSTQTSKTCSTTVKTSNNQSTPHKEKKVRARCFECEKSPASDTLFCSEACILKHVFKAQHRLKASNKANLDSKQHVMVMDPRSNKMLTGPNAPTISNLEEWMKTHPSYHVVMPPSLPKSNKKTNNGASVSKESSSKAKSFPSSTEKTLIDQKLAQYHQAEKEVSLSRLSAAKKSLIEEERRKFSASLSSSSSHGKPLSSSHIVHRKETSSHRRHPSSLPSSSMSSSSMSSSSKMKGETLVSNQQFVDPEPIRANIREGLLEALRKRVDGAGDVNVEMSTLKKLVDEIELAMYNLNHGDVGSKYKNKYRSLHFNISDEKNLGLFRKIVNGAIVAKQLVSLTPGELASRELQEWREKELKEEIEKIKSYELDMMSKGHKLLLKSHKGELIIDTDDNTEVQLPDEIKLKESETIPFTAHHKLDASELQLAVDQIEMKDGSKEQEQHGTKKHKRSNSDRERKVHKKKRSKDKDERKHSSGKNRSSSSSSKHRHHRHHHPKHNKKSDGKQEGENKKPSESHKEKKEGEKEESFEDVAKKRDEENGNMSNIKKPIGVIKDDMNAMTPNSVSVEPLDIKEASTQQLMSQSSQAQGGRGNNVEEKKAESPKLELVALKPAMVANSTSLVSSKSNVTDVADKLTTELLEPSLPSEPMDEVSSTVHILTPPQISQSSIWQGALHMPDVANFNVDALGVSGPTDYLDVDLKSPLRIVGRISPEAVFDYMNQVAESGHKEIVVMRLQPLSKLDHNHYDTFFNYLESRARFGVVGNADKMVKDCYIAYLKSDQSLHKSLTASKLGPGLEDQRPNLLLALVVRARRKRKTDSSLKREVSYKRRMTSTTTEKTVRKNDDDSQDPYDPATAGFESINDDEEVYDPENASFEMDLEDNDKSKREKKKTALYSDPNDPRFSPPETDSEIQHRTKSATMTRELERITKQIEQSKKELEGFEASKSSSNDGEVVNLPGLGYDQSGPVAGFQSLPSSIASILFNNVAPNDEKESSNGGNSDSNALKSTTATRDPRRPWPSSTALPSTTAITSTLNMATTAHTTSTLGSMSGADLVAKAEAMMMREASSTVTPSERPSPWLHPPPNFSQQPASSHVPRARSQERAERRYSSSRHSRHGGGRHHYDDDRRDRRGDRRRRERDRRRDDRRRR